MSGPRGALRAMAAHSASEEPTPSAKGREMLATAMASAAVRVVKRGQVQLQADEEEKQEQANVGQRVEHGEALHRVDVVEEGLVSAKR